MKTVRTRFAPSPTGELHLGNARIAVLNWLYARHCDGHFVLRIEDTDVDRNLPDSEASMMASLHRLGITWDEGPDVGGTYGPYRQSERRALYDEFAQRLMSTGAAFRCYCSPEDLERMREAAFASGLNPVYDGTCRNLSPSDEERHREQGIAPSIRFIVNPGQIVVNDVVRGAVTFDASEFGDFVIMKSDGLPTYNFAVVVDDATMKISHVIRGAGHLTNTSRQVMLYQALEIDPPTFVHVPHVLAPDGAGLSKRHGARSLGEYLDAGFHPEAVLNYLSLLSWSSPSGDEILPVDTLIDEIELGRIGASDVRMDPEKLEWLSGEHIRRMTPEDLAQQIVEILGADTFQDVNDDRVRIAAAIQERITTFSATAAFLPQFYPPDPMEWEPEALENLQNPDVLHTLEVVLKTLARVEDWDGDTAVAAVRVAGEEAGAKGRQLFMPVRAAVTGSTRGPDLVAIFQVQGKATTLRVVEQACEYLRRNLEER